jgi:gamma-glutamyltranspeptidase/glutathione hydrolase
LGADLFAIVYDPKTKTVNGLNGSGRSPRGLAKEKLISIARNPKIVPNWGPLSITVPGVVDAW